MVLLSIVDTVSPARTCWYHTILGPGVSGNRGREHPRQVTTSSQDRETDNHTLLHPHQLTSTALDGGRTPKHLKAKSND